ncbi:hypothetical protein CR513_17192, partial [Mucuna pruriens]
MLLLHVVYYLINHMPPFVLDNQVSHSSLVHMFCPQSLSKSCLTLNLVPQMCLPGLSLVTKRLSFLSYSLSLLYFYRFLDGKNFEQWCIKMGVIFGFQEVLEVVKNDIQEVEVGVQEERVQNSLLDSSMCGFCHFEKIASANSAKKA